MIKNHKSIVKPIEKNVFFSYKGLLKCLFTSRSGDADKFVDWATKTLFTVQMGKKEAKRELAKNLVGTSYDSVKGFTKNCLTNIAAIYLIGIGYAKDLREKMNIPADVDDSCMVTKFGHSKDFNERIMTHNTNFSKITNNLFF